MARNCWKVLITSFVVLACAEPRDMVKRSEFESAMSENARLLNELTDARQKRERLSADLAATNNEAEELKLTLESEKENANSQINQLEDQLQIASDDLDEKKQKIEQLTGEIQSGTDNLELKQAELDDLKAQYEADLALLLDRETELYNTKQDLTDTQERLNNLEANYQVILNKLLEEGIEIDPALLDIDSAGAAISNAASELTEANDSLIAELNDADHKLSLISDDFVGQQAEKEFIRQLQLKINEGEAGLQTASQHLADAMIVITYLQEDRDKWKALAQERGQRIAELEARVKELEAQLGNGDDIVITLN